MAKKTSKAAEPQPQPLSAFGNQLDRFDGDQEGTLALIWQVLDHAPEFTFADGAVMRPITSNLFIHRWRDEGVERFELLRFDDIRDEMIAGFKPGRPL